jgi:hypothetical protein
MYVICAKGQRDEFLDPAVVSEMRFMTDNGGEKMGNGEWGMSNERRRRMMVKNTQRCQG